MAEISEIVSKEAIQSIKDADKAVVLFDGDIDKLIQKLKGLTGAGSGLKDLNKTITESANAAKKYNDVQNQTITIQKKVEQANKALNTEGAKRAAAMDREIAKEKELESALKGELGAYKQLTVQVSQAKKAYLEIAAAQGINSKAAKEAQLTHDKLNKSLTDINRNAAIYSPEVGKYGMMWDKVKGFAMGAVGALGITAGLAGAMKLVQGVMQSTDVLADEFERTMSGLKESVQFTARAFANFDFTNFLSGLAEANKEGRRYADTIDLIGDLQRANQLQANDIERQILEQRIIAKDKSNDIKLREAAIKEIVRLEELKLSQLQVVTKKGIDNELKNSAFRTKAQEKDVLDLVQNYDKKVSAIEQGNKIIQDIEAKTRSTTMTPYGETVQVDTKAREKAYASLNASQKESVKWANIDKQLTEDKRIALVAAIDADQKATNEMLSGKESLIRIENGLRNELLKTEAVQTSSGGKSEKAIEKQRTEYQKLTDHINDVSDAITELKLADQPVPQSMVHDLISSQAKLEGVKKEVEAIAAGMLAIAGKNTKGILMANPVTGRPLTPRPVDWNAANDKGGGDGIFAGYSKKDKKDYAVEQAQVTSDTIFTIIRNKDQAILDGKLSDLEAETQAKLKNTRLTEAQKEKIQADADKKAAKLKTEAAKKEKAAAIIQAIIATALGVAKASPDVPLMIAAGIAGAAQVAIIASQPIPKFDKGTLNSPDTFIAGEKRPEFLKSPQGKISFVSKPTMFTGMAGSTVISGEDTERIMKVAGRDGINGMTFMPDIKGMTSEIVNAIQNKSELHISASGSKITERSGNYHKEYFNRKISWSRNQN